jgi:hypothetical protein
MDFAELAGLKNANLPLYNSRAVGFKKYISELAAADTAKYIRTDLAEGSFASLEESLKQMRELARMLEALPTTLLPSGLLDELDLARQPLSAALSRIADFQPLRSNNPRGDRDSYEREFNQSWPRFAKEAATSIAFLRAVQDVVVGPTDTEMALQDLKAKGRPSRISY